VIVFLVVAIFASLDRVIKSYYWCNIASTQSNTPSFRIDIVASGIQYPQQTCQALFSSFHSDWIPDVAARIRDDGGVL
jgi:hypothetical protein